MAVEQEIKLRVASAEAAREALARLGAARVGPRHLEDNLLFDSPRLGLAAQGKILRLRRTHKGSLLTYKGPRRVREGIKTREEIELAVAEPDALQALLEQLGLAAGFRYQKYREVWSWSGQEIVVDETPIGAFLEIEGEPEGIRAAATALGFSPEDFITDSYAALFFAAGGKGDMVFG